MKVTQQMLTQQFVYNITNTNNKMQNLEEELSTGKVLNKPSDNPLAVSQDMAVRASVTQMQGYQSTINMGLNWMNNSSSAIQGIITSLQSVQNYVLEGINVTDSNQGSTLSKLVGKLQESINQTLDTQQGDNYLFGGTSNVQPSTTSPSSRPSGDMNYQVSNDISIKVNVTAKDLEQPAGTSLDLNTTLSKIQTDLKSVTSAGTAPLQSDLTDLQTVMTNVINQNADLGTRIKQMTAMQNQISTYTQNLQQLQSNLEDANMAQVITSYSTTQNVYDAALKMGSGIISQSLVDFLPNGG